MHELDKIDTEIAALRNAWQALNMAEIQALALGEKILGKETLLEQAGVFFEKSDEAQTRVNGLKEKLIKVADAPVSERQAFIREYTATMPECCDTLYDITVAFTSALIEFSTRGTKPNTEARALLTDLEGIQSGKPRDIRRGMSNIHARHQRSGLKVVAA